jgi:hypothetical protein
MTTATRNNGTAQLAKSEYCNRDTSPSGYRAECLLYLSGMVKSGTITPSEEAATVPIITKGIKLEAWKTLNLLWLEHTSKVGVEYKPLLKDEITTATEDTRCYVFSRLMEIYVANTPPITPTREAWKPAYAALNSMARNREPLNHAEWWFLNRIYLLAWYKEVGMPFDEPSTRSFDMPPLW